MSFPVLGTWIEISPEWTWQGFHTSFPVLGTWIEISSILELTRRHLVVPCIGNVDWNSCLPCTVEVPAPSFPVLGTWIEIQEGLITGGDHMVVPCIGNVDWNYPDPDYYAVLISRSLYWERGLKFLAPFKNSSSQSRSLYWERGLKCKSYRNRI